MVNSSISSTAPSQVPTRRAARALTFRLGGRMVSLDRSNSRILTPVIGEGEIALLAMPDRQTHLQRHPRLRDATIEQVFGLIFPHYAALIADRAHRLALTFEICFGLRRSIPRDLHDAPATHLRPTDEIDGPERTPDGAFRHVGLI